MIAVSLNKIWNTKTIPLDIIDIIGEYAKKDIDFLNMLETVKQNNQPIEFRHSIDECVLEKSTIRIETYDCMLRLWRKGKVDEFEIKMGLPVRVIVPINDYMDLTVTNIDQMIDNALITRKNVGNYLRTGEPMYYMPDGMNYALFDLMERIGKIPKL